MGLLQRGANGVPLKIREPGVERREEDEGSDTDLFEVTEVS